MFVMCSRGRPHALRDFVAACVDTGSTLPIYCIVDCDDALLEYYQAIELPDNIRLVVSQPALPAAHLDNCVTDILARADIAFIGVLSDDLRPRTNGWDVALVAAAGDKYISWAADGIRGGELCCHPVIGRKLLEAVRFFTPPGLKHFFADNFWHAVGRAGRLLRYMPEVRVDHLHPSAGTRASDATTEGLQRHWEHDCAVWEDYCAFGDLDIICNRVARTLGDE